ncbi:MAG: aldose 1-epimerase family protein [Clostridia bacterium]|nr:aldose 1-epimerase family protein [Clostridia bacterium]
MNKYIGNEKQLYGVDEMILCTGKGKGMKILQVRNGSGLEFNISADRCGDISKLSFKGDNYCYFSPVGYVAPDYYEKEGINFLKSFTAGFITTCGLTNVGNPCEDEGETFGLHGSISNTPCDNICHYIENGEIHIKATIRDARMFSHHFVLEREYIVPLFKNELYMTDTVKNIGSIEAPVQVLYHCNLGYPLLQECTKFDIPATEVTGRDEHASNHIDTCLQVESPTKGYQEMCFYHKMEGTAKISVYNPEIKKGLNMIYDTKELGCFTQWKLMNEYEYVMGIEPGNAYPDGRDVMREKGMLEMLAPGNERKFSLKFEFTE